MNIKDNEFYKKWFKSAWTYVVGAVLLSLFQIVTLATTGNPLGISSVFATWGAWLYISVGGSVDKWYYFSSDAAKATLNAGLLNDPGSIRNIAIIFGALLATLLASQFKIKKIKSKKQLVAVSLGGLLMGYGARIGLGCNIGAFYSGVSSLSLSGWVFGIFLFLGAIVGSKILVKFLM
ncbi:YeeE/YedE thiosulfate transporter family protein [Clostridium sp.]|uniref:YeeE/YedE thiosulfate transporter family protein n=1 Tax=Clostridium sp. TaxID=1506 RepID=UPI003D6C7822